MRIIKSFCIALGMASLQACSAGSSRSDDDLQSAREALAQSLTPFVSAGLSMNGATELAGSSPGIFEVTNGGSATYAIPLSVPPGTGKIAPDLGLGYDSQSGSGSVGVGWALTGLSAITRCAAMLEPDGFIDPVDLDDNDRFCLPFPATSTSPTSTVMAARTTCTGTTAGTPR